ncbi:hypothetical protein [Algoriphagus sp.]|uniref:hypothetical protein n=1 Tax=Algoriphagus sp. TaxID=1872435 RepID=UPI00391928FD
MIRPNFSFDYFPAFPSLTPDFQVQRIDALGNYRLGIRKTWEQGKHAFYAQPSVGFTVNNYWDFARTDSTSFFFANRETKIVGNVGMEAGMKFNTRRKNYLLVGLRHQSGLSSLNPIEIGLYAGNSQAQVQRRGSYTGMFVGYGIDFKGRTRDEKLEERLERQENKSAKREIAWGSGPYLSVNGLLRFRPKSEREPNLEFSHISGGYEFLGGYTLGSFSVESGYSKFNAYTNVRLPGGLNINTPTNYSVSAIPVRLRYHMDIGDKKRLRLGTSLAAFYTLDTKGRIWYEGAIGGYSNTTYNLTSTPLDQNIQGKLFFNAGVFAEIPIFNSSMITFNFSRNFGSPEVGKINVSGNVNAEPVNFDSSGSLNGWIMEVGYKLPLKSLFK